MKKLRILAATLVVLALLMTAFVPATGLAASSRPGIQPRPADAPGNDTPGDNTPSDDTPGDDAAGDEDFATPPEWHTEGEQRTQTVTGVADGGTAAAVGVLCAADVTIDLQVPQYSGCERYVWSTEANPANPLPGANNEGTLIKDPVTTGNVGSSITLGKDDIVNAGTTRYVCEAQSRDTDESGNLTGEYRVRRTWTFPVTAYGATLQKVQPAGDRIETLVRFTDDNETLAGTIQVSVSRPTIPERAITVGPTQIQDDHFYWHREDRNDGWGRDKVKETTVSLTQTSKDLLAGEWDYICEARGVGFDRKDGHNVVTVPVHTRAQLQPINDYSSPANFGLTQASFTNGIEASDITTVDNAPTMSVAFEISRQNEAVPIGVEWAKGIAPEPGSVRYVWQADGEDPATVNNTVLLLSINTTRTDRWTCRTEIVDDEHFPNGANDWATPVINVSIRLVANRPEVQGIYMVRGTTMTPPTNHQFTLGQGYDLCLEVSLRNTGVEDLQRMSYFWWYTDPATKVPVPINPGGHDFDGSSDPTLKDFEVVSGGVRLWLRNISLAHKGAVINVQVSNSEGISSDGNDPNASVTLDVENRTVSPALTLEVDPAPLNNRVQVREGGSVAFTVTETAGINEEVLTYQWMMADTAGGPYTDISGATSATYKADQLKRRTGESTSSYYYVCAVTNTAGSYNVTTRTTEIWVEVLPQTGSVSFTVPASEVTYTGDHRLMSGTSLELTVKVGTDNNDPVTYQWEMAYGATEREVRYTAIPQIIALATSETYDTGLLDAGWYMFRCIAENTTNTNMRATSPMFIVEVEQNPDIPIVEYLTEREVGVCEGETARMKIRAYTVTGDPVSYQWREVTGGTNTIIASGIRPTLTLARVESSQNDTQYICRVTNDRTNEIYDTKTFTLHVWNEEDMPVITTQPVNLRMQRNTTGAVAGQLEIIVEATEDSNFAFYWERWNEGTEEWAQADQEPEDFIGETSCSSVLHFTGVESDAGKYRCAVENMNGNPAGATTNSNEVTVVLRDRHVPTITSQPPTRVYASVGKTASLRVIADIEPAQAINYTWMVTPDGGKTWRNATSSDGSGCNTNVFTTQPMHKNDLGRALLYKCKLQGADGGVAVETNISQVITKNPSPELVVNSDSPLHVTVNPSTGERFLTGQDITDQNQLLTPQFIVQMFDLSDTRGAKVEVTKNGESMEENAAIGTGCVVTLLDSKGVALDEVEIVVMGDVLGTGQATLSQLVALAQVLTGQASPLTGARAFAADHNGNGVTVELSDIVVQAQLFREASGSAITPTPTPGPSPEPSTR